MQTDIIFRPTGMLTWLTASYNLIMVDFELFRFMRICGLAGEILRGEASLPERFPVRELEDYWNSRPRYEPALIPWIAPPPIPEQTRAVYRRALEQLK